MTYVWQQPAKPGYFILFYCQNERILGKIAQDNHGYFSAFEGERSLGDFTGLQAAKDAVEKACAPGPHVSISEALCGGWSGWVKRK